MAEYNNSMEGLPGLEGAWRPNAGASPKNRPGLGGPGDIPSCKFFLPVRWPPLTPPQSFVRPKGDVPIRGVLSPGEGDCLARHASLWPAGLRNVIAGRYDAHGRQVALDSMSPLAYEKERVLASRGGTSYAVP